MNWECHIQNICKKIDSALGAIKRIRHLIPFNILINAYDILVQSHFNYCSAPPLSGATVAVVFLKSFRSSKIVQPVF